MFKLHPSAALEYWFFKVNTGPIALIVDWIERRKQGEHVLRVSIHSPYKREVVFEKLTSYMPGDNFMTTQKTTGHAGDVSWDLEIDPGQEYIHPDIFPSNLLKMTDTIIESAPLAKFTGWIRHGSQQTSLTNARGMISHYWGRQLYPEWWWISAQQFDQEDVMVECAVGRSRLWGTAAQIPLGYFYLHRQGKSELIMAPNQTARVSGSPDNFQLEITRRNKEKITLIGTGREYGDFGDHIINTLTGDLEIREGDRVIARANGTAGLERRIPNPK